MDNPVALSHSYTAKVSELRHRDLGNLYLGDTKLSVHETPTPPCGSRALLETVTGNPYFFHLVWEWRGCLI